MARRDEEGLMHGIGDDLLHGVPFNGEISLLTSRHRFHITVFDSSRELSHLG